ncbi:hypothetical protein [Streptomyces uncialis]|uniref:hypothetical protein n=1 Tax=Streptomyces uncialis TaxID=1048205 RepID=UPI0033F25D65
MSPASSAPRPVPRPGGRPARAARALLVCAALLVTAACGGGSPDPDPGPGGTSTPSPVVGTLLDTTDPSGNRLREVPEEEAPGVRVAVRPGSADTWDVRLTVTGFRFSPRDTRTGPVPGRGYAVLFLADRRLAELREPGYRLPDAALERGTHELTVRLHADDGTVWAVDGEAVEDIARVTTAPRKDRAAGDRARSTAPTTATPS